MFFPKKELFLMIAENIREEDARKYDRVHKIVYLVGKKIKERYNRNIGYNFNSFMSHAGPYDKELQDDIDTWCTVGLIRDRHDNKPTQLGKSFQNNTGINRIEKILGGKQNIELLRKDISNYSLKADEELIKEAVLLWSQEHPEQKNKIKEFFPFLQKNSS